MKYVTVVFLLWLGLGCQLAKAQRFVNVLNTYTDLANFNPGFNTNVFLAGGTSFNDGNQGVFTYYLGSSALPISNNIIVSSVGNGRWFRQLAATTNSVLGVNNIAQMLSSNPANYTQFLVKGYHTPNDGGGGQFYAILNDGSATNLGTTFRFLSNTNYLALRISSEGALNVTWFGADPKGLSDSTLAIQNALNVGPGLYGPNVYVPAGDYAVTNLYVKYDNMKFFGDGAGTRLLCNANRTSGTNRPIVRCLASGVTLESFSVGYRGWVTGDYKTNWASATDPIYDTGVALGTSLLFTGPSSGIYITNVENTGVSAQVISNIVVRAVSTFGTRGHSVFIANAVNCVITECDISESSSTGIWGDVASPYVTLQNNKIQYTGDDSIFISSTPSRLNGVWSPLLSADMKSVSIIGNRTRVGYKGVGVCGYNGITVSGNTISLPWTSAIWVSPDGINTNINQNISIVGNVCGDCFGGFGPGYKNATNVQATLGGEYSAIQFGGSTNVTISGNSVQCATNSINNTSLYGISTGATYDSTDVIIAGNTVEGFVFNQLGSTLGHKSTDILIYGNIFSAPLGATSTRLITFGQNVTNVFVSGNLFKSDITANALYACINTYLTDNIRVFDNIQDCSGGLQLLRTDDGVTRLNLRKTDPSSTIIGSLNNPYNLVITNGNVGINVAQPLGIIHATGPGTALGIFSGAAGMRLILSDDGYTSGSRAFDLADNDGLLSIRKLTDDFSSATTLATLDTLGNFSVASPSLFNINSSGNITKLNGVTTSFPSIQGGIGSYMQNDGSGNLSWSSSSAATGSGTATSLAKWLNSTNLTDSYLKESGGFHYPATNAVITLGSTTNRFVNVYSAGGNFSGTVNMSGLTASKLVVTDGSQNLSTANTITSAQMINPYGPTGGTFTITSGSTTLEVIEGASAGRLAIADTGTTSGSRAFDIQSNDGVLNFRQLSDDYVSSATVRFSMTAGGVLNIPGLTASLPVQTDSSKNLVSSAINLASSQVTGLLPWANVIPVTGVGVTNISSVLSGNYSPGSNVTFTTNANGNVTVASSGGSAGTVGTMIHSGTSAAFKIPVSQDTTGTNWVSRDILAGSNVTITTNSSGFTIAASSSGGTVTGTGSANNVAVWSSGSALTTGPLNVSSATNVTLTGELRNNILTTTNSISTINGGIFSGDQVDAVSGFTLLGSATKGSLLTGDGVHYAEGPTGTNGQVLMSDSAQATGTKWATVSGTGTVTSVDLSVPAEFSVSGNPVTTSGTLTVAKATQSANTVWAGPTSGSAAQPAFRTLSTLNDLQPQSTGVNFTKQLGSLNFNVATNYTIFTVPTSRAWICTGLYICDLSSISANLNGAVVSLGNAVSSTNLIGNKTLNTVNGCYWSFLPDQFETNPGAGHQETLAGDDVKIYISNPSAAANTATVAVTGFYIQ